ncbi:MAG TPA: TRASH domain-containing protein [Prosthecobacter sp.]
MKRSSFLFLAVLALGLSPAMAEPAKVDGLPATYPLKTCVVSGEEFGGAMGKPVKVTHEGTDVYLCCKSCLKDFKKDPAKYTQKVKDAAGKK